MSFSLLETLRLQHGTLVRLERHLARLEASARHFEFAYDEPRTRAALAAVVQAQPSGIWRTRVLIDRDGTPTVECVPLPADTRTSWRVAFAADCVESNNPLLRHKTTDRNVYEHAKRARPDVDEILLWNERGEVTEGTITNIVVEIGGTRYTPPVTSGLLPGVFRGELLTAGRIAERPLTRDDITNASRLWLINSLREWVNARLV